MDPDSTFHFDADPDPDEGFQIKRLKKLKKCSNRLIFHTFLLVISKLMGIHPDPAYHFDADPGPSFQVDADPDPQDCYTVPVAEPSLRPR